MEYLSKWFRKKDISIDDINKRTSTIKDLYKHSEIEYFIQLEELENEFSKLANGLFFVKNLINAVEDSENEFETLIYKEEDFYKISKEFQEYLAKEDFDEFEDFDKSDCYKKLNDSGELLIHL